MFLRYVHARVRKAAPGKLHVQATGDAFPQGYASGDIDVEPDVYEAVKASQRVPSMRGSGRVYTPLTVEDSDVLFGDFYVCATTDLLEALSAPQPSYSTDDVQAVANRVATTMQAATEEPAFSGATAQPTKGIDKAALAASIAAAVTDALEAAGL
jgi:hypothetical protein